MGDEKVIPWWENSQTYRKLWNGSLFDRMVLKDDDEEEQRIQKLRVKAIERPQGKRGYLSIWRARLLTESYRKTEGEAAILRKAKGLMAPRLGGLFVLKKVIYWSTRMPIHFVFFRGNMKTAIMSPIESGACSVIF